MASLLAALRQVKRQVAVARLFILVLNSALIFLLLAVLLVLIGLPWAYSLIPSVVYFLVFSLKTLKDVKLKEAEERVPELEWQLRTAEDTLGKEDEVVESLRHHVLEKIASMKNWYFVDNRHLGYKVSGAIGLLVLLFVFSFFHVTVIDVTDPESITGFFSRVTEIGGNALDKVNGSALAGKFGDRDIYGKEDAATLGNEELELKLKREKSQIDYDSFKDLEGKEFSQQNGLGEIGASADASFDEKIDKEHQELVRSYFEKLNSEGKL